MVRIFLFLLLIICSTSSSTLRHVEPLVPSPENRDEFYMKIYIDNPLSSLIETITELSQTKGSHWIEVVESINGDVTVERNEKECMFLYGDKEKLIKTYIRFEDSCVIGFVRTHDQWSLLDQQQIVDELYYFAVSMKSLG